ncbi:hypothetical protein [Pontibacter sp. G13]|uniref:hypothetical protein n=1 Tax=Pontibacter sp. G13 TaxID=3074898 RepID=UPI002889E08B|nr:hypothetical protein [Pontibacter sp. G13]WNJ17102.1 hypothetical protein RJD25_19785 [Pontibacter sp. G13]
MFQNRLFNAFLAVALMFSVSACDEDETASITITFEHPTAGEIVEDASDVEIHIHAEGVDGGEVDDMEVVLHPEGNVDDKIIDFDEHTHAESYEFIEKVDLSSYPSGTTFHLEVNICGDHDCELSKSEDIEFSIM